MAAIQKSWSHEGDGEIELQKLGGIPSRSLDGF